MKTKIIIILIAILTASSVFAQVNNIQEYTLTAGKEADTIYYNIPDGFKQPYDQLMIKVIQDTLSHINLKSQTIIEYKGNIINKFLQNTLSLLFQEDTPLSEIAGREQYSVIWFDFGNSANRLQIIISRYDDEANPINFPAKLYIIALFDSFGD